MIHSAKNMSAEQRHVIESLLGQPIADGEQISLRRVPASPEWLKSIQQDAAEKGVSELTMDEIDAEIAAMRQARRARTQQPEE